MQDDRYKKLTQQVAKNLKEHSRVIFLNALEQDIPGFIAMAEELNATVSYTLNPDFKHYTLTIK